MFPEVAHQRGMYTEKEVALDHVYVPRRFLEHHLRPQGGGAALDWALGVVELFDCRGADPLHSVLGPLGFNSSQHGPTTRPSVERTVPRRVTKPKRVCTKEAIKPGRVRTVKP